MDACHFLLGRPWQYDRKVSHNGLKNTHSFIKDGVRIVLAPMKSELKIPKEIGNSFLIGSQVEHALANQDEIYAILVMDATVPQQAPVYDLLLPLLEEFKDVVPDEIPIGLPPMRNIQHHTDLVPGSTFPNKAAYRMNPMQQAELQRQVEELIAGGLIHASMSPCVVPSLLVPKKDGAWCMC